MKVLSVRRIRFIPACIISAATVAAMVSPGAANATLGTQCSGADIQGQGAAVEKVAQGVWTTDFNTSAAKKACAGGQGDKLKPTVIYHSTSSGAGLRAWGAETKVESELNFTASNAFVASAEAPNLAQQSAILKEESTDTEGTLLTVPVTQFSLTVYVALPEGCTATSTPAPGRLVLSDKVLQEIYNGTIKTWGGITGGGDSVIGTGCASDPIIPVVRGEKAGTTNVLKKYLGLINTSTLETPSGSESWDALSEGKLNTVWPTALTGLVKTTIEGDEAEADKVASIPVSTPTDGAIGFSNLAELRTTNLFSGAGNGAGTSKFWVEIENGAKGTGKKEKVTYSDPATNGDVAAAGSANCAKTAYTNGANPFPPPSLSGLWNEVTTSVPTSPSPLKEKDYSLCNFAYVLAFTQYSLLEGKGATLQEATAVNNYLSFVAEKKGGQAELAGNDYDALPKAVASKVATGVATIGF
jgi:ABC-type phosphate transport system substrate-binding protein